MISTKMCCCVLKLYQYFYTIVMFDFYIFASYSCCKIIHRSKFFLLTVYHRWKEPTAIAFVLSVLACDRTIV